MTLTEFFTVLLRRWYILVPGVLLTLVASVGEATTSPPHYKAESMVLMLPSSTPPPQASPGQPQVLGANPYLSFDSSLRITADVLARSMSDDQTAQGLLRRGATSPFKIEAMTYAAGPMLMVSAEGTDAAGTNRTLSLATTEVARRLQVLQQTAGAPRYTWIRASQVARTPAHRDYKGLVQTVVVLLAVGLAGSVCITVLVESVVRHRRRRRGEEPPPRTVVESPNGKAPASVGDAVSYHAHEPSGEPADRGTGPEPMTVPHAAGGGYRAPSLD